MEAIHLIKSAIPCTGQLNLFEVKEQDPQNDIFLNSYLWVGKIRVLKLVRLIGECYRVWDSISFFLAYNYNSTFINLMCRFVCKKSQSNSMRFSHFWQKSAVDDFCD